METLQIITDCIDSGILIVLFVLFATGKLLSKKTLDGINKTYQETLIRISLDHNRDIKSITASYNRQIKNFKEIITILKKQNGVK